MARRALVAWTFLVLPAVSHGRSIDYKRAVVDVDSFGIVTYLDADSSASTSAATPDTNMTSKQSAVSLIRAQAVDGTNASSDDAVLANASSVPHPDSVNGKTPKEIIEVMAKWIRKLRSTNFAEKSSWSQTDSTKACMKAEELCEIKYTDPHAGWKDGLCVAPGPDSNPGRKECWAFLNTKHDPLDYYACDPVARDKAPSIKGLCTGTSYGTIAPTPSPTAVQQQQQAQAPTPAPVNSKGGGAGTVFKVVGVLLALGALGLLLFWVLGGRPTMGGSRDPEVQSQGANLFQDLQQQQQHALAAGQPAYPQFQAPPGGFQPPPPHQQLPPHQQPPPQQQQQAPFGRPPPQYGDAPSQPQPQQQMGRPAAQY